MILIQTGTVLPVVGAVITIDSISSAIVKSVGKTYGQKDWRKFKLGAKSWVNLTP